MDRLGAVFVDTGIVIFGRWWLARIAENRPTPKWVNRYEPCVIDPRSLDRRDVAEALDDVCDATPENVDAVMAAIEHEIEREGACLQMTGMSGLPERWLPLLLTPAAWRGFDMGRELQGDLRAARAKESRAETPAPQKA